MSDMYIANKAEFENKLSRIKNDGVGSLHVISDFDKTLTRPIVEGGKVGSTIAQIKEGNYLGKEYSDSEHKLFDVYYPIEMDMNIPLSEKIIKMQEWWEKHLQLMVKHEMTLDVANKIAASGNLKFRDNFHSFASLLHENSVPLLMFSAGLGDVIESMLKLDFDLYDNIHVVSNFLSYDMDGKAVGYKSKIIHSFNKNEVSIKDTPYSDQITERKNVILLGDIPSDTGMAEGVEHDTIIRIGFCNFDFEKNKEEWAKHFDVVLPDGSMDYVISLLNEIIE